MVATYSTPIAAVAATEPTVSSGAAAEYLTWPTNRRNTNVNDAFAAEPSPQATTKNRLDFIDANFA
jgi:hypothetical protein